MNINLKQTSLEYENLFNEIKNVFSFTYSESNLACYWLIGKLIFDFMEEKHTILFEFLKRLSIELKEIDGKIFFSENLEYMYLFYKKFPIFETISNSNERYVDILKNRFRLRWSMYKMLIPIENKEARDFYEEYAFQGCWSKEHLKSHIDRKEYELVHPQLKMFEIYKKEELGRIPIMLLRQADDHCEIFKFALNRSFNVALTNFHHAVELVLKAIILTKEKTLPGKFSHGKSGHDLNMLLNYIRNNLKIIVKFNDEEELVIEEVSRFYQEIKYSEVAIFIRTEQFKIVQLLENIYKKILKVSQESSFVPAST